MYMYVLFEKSKINKVQYMLPEDDRVIETCRRVLNVSM